MRSHFVKESFFPVPRRDLFALHERSDALELLTPEWAGVEFESTVSTLAPSDEVAVFRTGLGPIRFRFEFVHTGYEKDCFFADEERKGLFSSWRHEHRFAEAGWEGAPASLLSDSIEYSHPLLALLNPVVRRRLARMFDHRHRVTAEQLAGVARSVLPPRTVAVTGGTGLIGRRVIELLVARGARVIALARDVAAARAQLPPEAECVRWDLWAPDVGDWRAALASADVVLHLAGTPLFSRRWSPAFKRRMAESRTESTRQLVGALRDAGHLPEAFLSASAVGIYGLDPRREADEATPPADDLLARICVDWEREARALEADGVRAAQLRLGVVLSPRSGALKEVLPLFRLGLGGVFGASRPWLNWIHLEDAAQILAMAVYNPEVRGPVNVVAPRPVRNADYAATLARVLRRPAWLSYPTSLIELAIGEAGAYASGGAKVSASRLERLGYHFFFDDLESALSNALGRPASGPSAARRCRTSSRRAGSSRGPSEPTGRPGPCSPRSAAGRR